jgi:hypothetical protein
MYRILRYIKDKSLTFFEHGITLKRVFFSRHQSDSVQLVVSCTFFSQLTCKRQMLRDNFAVHVSDWRTTSLIFRAETVLVEFR